MEARVSARHRVVVTGMGVVTPLGSDVDAFAEALLAGRSGVGPITIFDASTLPTRIAGESRLPDDAPLGDRKIAFALEATRQAMRAASACGSRPVLGDTASVSMGVGLELFSMRDLAASRKPGWAPPSTARERLATLQTPSDLCVHLIAREHGLAAPPRLHVSACAAGTDAIGAGFRLIASGKRRTVIAGGTDSMINPMGVAGFCALTATSTRNDEPARASRPFDRTRDGFVMGEGAGALVLERLDDARARGATIYAELRGYGNSFDAHGISDPHPEGRGAWQAMQAALDDAGLAPEDVDAINAHGTGTPKNDPVETLAIKRLLGARAPSVPICATKSMIGHLISAAGAVEAIAAIECLRRGRVHPTINLEHPDPACDLDYVVGGARVHAQRHVLSSSYGFGGQNAAIVLSRWEGA
jgi:3-oxoacyl-[acyl-carrier-protein] synthase II